MHEELEALQNQRRMCIIYGTRVQKVEEISFWLLLLFNTPLSKENRALWKWYEAVLLFESSEW